MSSTIPFEIIRMDPLGQGVSLLDEKVTFIPKTVVGDKGLARVVETKGKKVQFAVIEELSEPSKDRIESVCPHFSECQGCSYLAMDYEKEVEAKLNAYGFLFKKYFDQEKIVFHKSPERLGYRNRIQLHYDTRKFGFTTRDGLLEVPECRLPLPKVQEELRKLYDMGFHAFIPEKQPESGHFELTDDQKSIKFNKKYSDGGFRQVNEPIAKVAFERVKELGLMALSGIEDANVIDLFGGNGFLSQFHDGFRMVVDRGEQRESNETFHYIDTNLYGKFASAKVNKHLTKLNREHRPSLLIVDPPRSGMKNLAQFSESPYIQDIIYLSCNPQSQIRDIQNLNQRQKWEVVSLDFFDFFPATHHLETLVHLKRS